MVLVSKAVATNKKGEVKKGFKKVETSNGRIMFFSETPKKKDVVGTKSEKSIGRAKKEVKKDKPKKTKKKSEEIVVDFDEE